MTVGKGCRHPVSKKSWLRAGGVHFAISATTLVALALCPTHASAQTSALDPNLRDSFPIGSSDGALCRVQSELLDPAMTGMFDRAWAIICRDAAQPVGRIFALRGQDALARVESRPNAPTCPASAGGEPVSCSNYIGGLPGIRSVVRRDDTLFIGEGLAVYRDAVRLAMASVIERRVVEGKIDVATTGAGCQSAN